MIADIISAGQSVLYLRQRLSVEQRHRGRENPTPAEGTEARRIAVHEASHAVVCAALGGVVNMVVRHPANTGGVCYGRVEYAAPLAHHVAFHMAGAAGERVLLGLNAVPSADDDRLTSRLLAGARHAERELAKRQGAELADRLVREHRQTVLRLADALSVRSLVRGSYLARILKPARHGRNETEV